MNTILGQIDDAAAAAPSLLIDEIYEKGVVKSLALRRGDGDFGSKRLRRGRLFLEEADDQRPLAIPKCVYPLSPHPRTIIPKRAPLRGPRYTISLMQGNRSREGDAENWKAIGRRAPKPTPSSGGVHLKSDLPDLGIFKPISGKPEIGSGRLEGCATAETAGFAAALSSRRAPRSQVTGLGAP